MKVYHGTCIGGLISLIRSPRAGLYVTDTPAHAGRYANARATGVVSADYADLAEGAAIVEMEVNDDTVFFRRPPTHPTLDTCEAYVQRFRIISVEMKPDAYSNTLYGRRGDYMRYTDIVAMLEQKGIVVVVR